MAAERTNNAAPQIAVTAMGMVAALGHDAPTVCAAARAGLAHAQEVSYTVRSPVDGEFESAVGHVVPELTRGFEGRARLLRLLQGALDDLRRGVPEELLAAADLAYYAAIPDPRRIYTGGELLADEDERQELAERAAAIEVSAADEAKSLLDGALAASDAGDGTLRAVTGSGHTGVIGAMARACEDLRRGDVRYAVVWAVDSLLEGETLAWLEMIERLKSPAVPTGLQPGEAGVALLLERTDRARADDREPLALVGEIATASDPRSFLSGESPHAEGITAVLTQLAGTAWANGERAWLVTDQNGEPYRASEWGHGVVRMVPGCEAFRAPELWFPAASCGDTGAASAAVATCMVARAFVRDYAPIDVACVLSSSDGPERAGMLLHRPSL